MSESQKQLLEDLSTSLDPFGIFSSSLEVQKAWWDNPERLAEELNKLGTQTWDLQLQAWNRLLNGGPDDNIEAHPRDERFQDSIWTENAFLDELKKQYLLITRWLEDSIYSTPGVSDKTRERAAFWVRQVLNAAAPTNYFWTNPAAVIRAFETGGKSLSEGFKNFLSDMARGTVSMVEEDAFEVGVNLATTPGAVVYRNELMELIQYSPTTEQVHSTPIVFIPPWINKYYILDLDPKKSMLRYLVGEGFTVFVVSWKNPGSEMRATTMDDYLLKGVHEAIEAARDICQVPQVHLTGYCIGGTIVAAYMAWMNRQARKKSALPVAHWTALTALTDFSNPGEIEVFISDAAVASLEKRMADSGYLDGNDMATTFRMMRSNSLIWHYYVHNYLFGETPPAFDVLYWNMDCTRMPEAMHSAYLREFYLENRLSQKDSVTLAGRPIDLGRIQQPLYAVGTEQDHIAPWTATFKTCSLVGGPVRYVLATSGHILGIVSPPVDPPKRRYWAGDAAGRADPEVWRDSTEKVPGSWWTDWTAWLAPQCGELRAPPALGNATHPPLGDAPGTYVLEK